MTSMHKTYSSVEVVDEEDQEVEDLETDQEVVDSDDEVEVLVEVVTELDLDLVEVIEVGIEVAEAIDQTEDLVVDRISVLLLAHEHQLVDQVMAEYAVISTNKPQDLEHLETIKAEIEVDLDLVEVIEVEIEVAETMLLAAEMEDIVVPEIILSLDTTIPIVDEHLLEGNV